MNILEHKASLPYRHLVLKSIVFSGLILFLCLNQGQTQTSLQAETDRIYKSKASNEEKQNELQELISKQDTAQWSLELAYAYHKSGLLYNRNKEYEKAIAQTLKAVRIRSSIDSVSIKDLNNSLFNITVYLKGLGRAYEGEPYLKQILKQQSSDRFYYKALIELAILKKKKGDYYEALQNLQEVVGEIDPKKQAYIYITAILKSIWIYAEMDRPQEHLTTIETLKSKLEYYELDAEDTASVNSNLGIIYSKLGDSEKTIEHYFKVLEVYRFYNDSIGQAKLFNNLGIQYSILGQYDKARSFYDKALKLGMNKTKAEVYDNQAFYFHQETPLKQLELYQKAINTLLEKKTEIDIYALPELSTIEQSVQRLDLLFFLIDKATAWVSYFEQNGDKDHLLQAQKTLYLIDQLTAVIRLDSESRQSKLFWINRGVDFYVLAVKVCFLLDQAEAAFYFMERNKSLLLLEDLEKIKPSESRFLNTLSLEQLVDEELDEETVFVEFILNESEAYGLLLSKQQQVFFELENVTQLIANIKQLKQMVKQPFESKTDFEVFENLSFAVFKALFPIEGMDGLLANKKLKIIADYELHNLAFELLVNKKSEEAFSKNYLLQTAEISYLHSYSVAKQLSKIKPSNEHKMIAFAPTVFKNNDLHPLYASEEEMKTMTKLFPVELLLRQQATKARFIQSLNQYDIIHINSHAAYDKNTSPWLAFYDQKISLNELINCKNQSNLVVLDACKSALGTHELGEGVMSLARAFFHGGSSSVIAAQWKVNEKSSAEIFTHFYKNLKAGQSKSAALRQAKLTYLENHQLGQLSPYYWASFSLMGDAAPLDIKDDNNIPNLILLCCVILFSLAFYIKKSFF